MFTAKIKTCSGYLLFEGDYDKCMSLVHAVMAFDKDYVEVEVWDTDTAETKFRKKNEYWS